MKVAIMGGGPAGLACAIECEKLGIQAELFERNARVGWLWPSINFWPNIFYNNLGFKDAREYVKKEFGTDFTVLNNTNSFIMKSAGKQASVKGTLGLTVGRGTADESLENQLLRQLTKTPIHYNHLGDYNALAKEYEFVVVATGRETEARNMGLWQDEGSITIIGSIAVGNFDINSSTVYFNTEYAGTGYGRVTPFNQQCATVELYIIGKPEMQALELFQKFIQMEKLDTLDYIYKNIPPTFTTGKVTKFQKDNILLAGRSAGLTDRVLGVGAVEALISGTMAARSIAGKEDYSTLVKPLQSHIENISAFRKNINNFSNEDFDKIVSILGAPLIKQAVYNTRIDFVGKAGKIKSMLTKS
jgi:flavin-dependent dehydrogenase